MSKLVEWQTLAYVLIFVGMVIEGEMFLFAGIFSAVGGYLSLPYVLITAFLGMTTGDILWYWAGPHFERWVIPKKILEMLLPVVDTHLKKRPALIIFLAKFIYFFHRLVLVRIKPCGIAFSQFMKIDLLAILVWLVISSAFGVFFAASFDLLKHYVRFAEVGLLAGLVLFLIAEHYAGKYFKKKLGDF